MSVEICIMIRRLRSIGEYPDRSVFQKRTEKCPFKNQNSPLSELMLTTFFIVINENKPIVAQINCFDMKNSTHAYA